jgi:hypothetical protein
MKLSLVFIGHNERSNDMKKIAVLDYGLNTGQREIAFLIKKKYLKQLASLKFSPNYR